MELPGSWLTTGAFAALCGTTKETLRHYRDIALLRPAHRGENGYFYYDAAQFYDFYAISVFRRTGTPLDDVRSCLHRQDPSETLALLREQQARLETEQRRLEEMSFMLSSTVAGLELGMSPDLQPRTAWFDAEHLLAIPAAALEAELDPATNEDTRLLTVLKRCRRLCREYGLQADSSLGAIHRPDQPAGPETITHLYTRIRTPGACPYAIEKPAGLYRYLCCRGRWDLTAGYAALAQHLTQTRPETSGPVYACDLAGFILNGTEKNAVSLLSIRLRA